MQVRSLGRGKPGEKEIAMPGEFHGQRTLAGYSSYGLKELDTTEQLSTHSH